MTVLVVGSTSNLSKALQAWCTYHSIPTEIVPTEKLRYWSSESNLLELKSFFSQTFELKKFTAVIYASGVTNPAVSQKTIEDLNFLFPFEITKLLTSTQAKILLPGAFMEKFPDYASKSTYLNSKLMLARALEQIEGNWLNLRFNQWYGGVQIRNHLFLGAVIESIRLRVPFRMSDGLQLREYHHIEDDIGVFFHPSISSMRGHLDVTHGQSMKVRDVAFALFSHFGLLDLLQIGRLPSALEDNYELYTRFNPQLLGLSFRETISGILDYTSSALENR